VGADADLTFYKRNWNMEVTAGNYMARPTRAAVNFLRHWASFEHRRPSGFSSADNGALPVALADKLIFANSAVSAKASGCAKRFS